VAPQLTWIQGRKKHTKTINAAVIVARLLFIASIITRTKSEHPFSFRTSGAPESVGLKNLQASQRIGLQAKSASLFAC
jgi:hypothetical protein